MLRNNSMNGNETWNELHMSKPTANIICVLGLIILTLNFTVLLTLSIKKNKFPPVYWLQLICLAVNDMLAGLANFLLSFIDSPFVSTSFVNCAGVVGFLFITQSASLFNIFGICIHRYLVLKRYNRVGFLWKPYNTIVCTISAWSLSTLLCSMPLFLYHKSENYTVDKYCSVDRLFGADIHKGVLLMVVGPYVCPLLFINIIYSILFFKMKRTVRIQPQSSTNNETSHSTQVMNKKKVEPALINRSAQNISSCTAETGSRGDMGSTSKENVELVPTGSSTISFLHSPVSGASRSQNASVKKSSSTPKNNNLVSSTQQTMSEVQKRAAMRKRKTFMILGIILLVLNICSWPSVVSMILKGTVSSVKLDRNSLISLFCVLCLNSAVNPVLYATRIPEFRAALLEFLHSVYGILTCRNQR